MKKTILTILLTISMIHVVKAQTDEYSFEEIIVRAEEYDAEKRFQVHVTEGFHGMPADTARLLSRVPGANLNSNGPLTSLANYRGMFGYRLHKIVDGIPITSAGPNAMDPPLSYAPRLQLKTLEVYRGIAPVSSGIETIGGTIVANSNKGEFAETEFIEFHGEINSDVNSNNNGVSSSILATMANDIHKVYVIGSREDGDNFDFDGGTIDPTVHERKNLKFGYGVRFDDNEASLDFSHVETERTGTPALPMDIWYFDSNMVNAEAKLSGDTIGLTASFFYTEIEHGMDNFSLRTPPPAAPPLAANGDTNTRFIIAESDSTGYSLKSTIEVGEGYITLGTDGDFAKHDATIFDPTNSVFRLENINDAERNRLGLFGEWITPLSDVLELEIGLRYNRVESNAKPVSARNPFLPGGAIPHVMTLLNRFNSADHSQEDNNVDAVIKISYDFSEELSFEVGLGRKTRSPNFIERYLWIPLEINGGLSDGNNYIGDPELDPEVAFEIDFGVNYTGENFFFRPRTFYKEVDDYIQGIPVHETAIVGAANFVSGANGDPSPLQFSNVDAALYGIDLESGIVFSDFWSLNGILSYVRGERAEDDIDDDLFRITPLNGIVSLTHQQEKWYASVEGVFYDRQSNVSQTNGEQKTSGYGIMNLRGQYTISENVGLSGGIENVFDRKYTEHLSGINRVVGTEIPRGQKLPGYGRSFYLALNVNW